MIKFIKFIFTYFYTPRPCSYCMGKAYVEIGFYCVPCDFCEGTGREVYK